MHRHRGFTLIELMIAVVVVAILVGVALPSYRSYTVRANRTVAKTLLSQIAQQQESWFGDRKTYASALSVLGYPADAMYVTSGGDPQSASSTTSTYRISLAGVGTGDFSKCSSSSTASKRFSWVLIAEPQNTQSTLDTACGTICLYSTGQRGASLSATSTDALTSCWAR